MTYLIRNENHLFRFIDGLKFGLGHFGNAGQVGFGVCAGDMREIEDGWFVRSLLG